MKFSRANAPKARPLIFIHNNLAQIGYCQRSHDRFRPNEPHIWGRALDTLLICSACTVYASCFFSSCKHAFTPMAGEYPGVPKSPFLLLLLLHTGGF